MKKQFIIPVILTALFFNSCKKVEDSNENKTQTSEVLKVKSIEIYNSDGVFEIEYSYNSDLNVIREVISANNVLLLSYEMVYENGKIKEMYYLNPTTNEKSEQKKFSYEGNKITIQKTEEYGVINEDDTREVAIIKDGKLDRKYNYYYYNDTLRFNDSVHYYWQNENLIKQRRFYSNDDCFVDWNYEFNDKLSFENLIGTSWEIELGNYETSKNVNYSYFDQTICPDSTHEIANQFNYYHNYNKDGYITEILKEDNTVKARINYTTFSK